MIDFTKYQNQYPTADFKTDPFSFDLWANMNDLLQEQFSQDLVTYMVEVLDDELLENVKDNTVILKKLQNIVEIVINEKDSYSDRFWFALELLPLVV